MKALLSRNAGGPDSLTLEEIPDPTPGPQEVLIEVRACALNFPDVLMIEDKYQYRPDRPFAPGGEISGIIAAIGTKVSEFAIGQNVIGWPGLGGLAEKVVVKTGQCLRMPESMSFDDGSAFVAAFGTSYHALKQRAAIKTGETLLVLGASGGVGLAACQLGRAMGAQVIAAVSSSEKAEVALSHGAHQAVIYAREMDDAGTKSFGAALKAVVGPKGADVVYDAVGGPYSEPALRCMAWYGRYLIIGFPAGIPRLPVNVALLKGCSVVGVFYGRFSELMPDDNDRNIAELIEFYRTGAIKPYISEHYSLANASEGLGRLSSREATGKLVVIISTQKGQNL